MRIRRLMIAIMVLSLVTGNAGSAVGEPGSERSARVVEFAYDLPTIGINDVASLCYACFTVQAGPKERRLEISAADEYSPNVYVQYGLDFDGDTYVDESGDLCTATTEPLRIRPFTSAIVIVMANPPEVPPGVICPGTATTGTVTVSFSR